MAVWATNSLHSQKIGFLNDFVNDYFMLSSQGHPLTRKPLIIPLVAGVGTIFEEEPTSSVFLVMGPGTAAEILIFQYLEVFYQIRMF